MTDNLEKTYLSSYFLCIFKDLKNDAVFKSFINFLKSLDKTNNIEENIEKYTDFINNLNNLGYNDFTLYLNDFIAENHFENNKQTTKELKIISSISKISYSKIKNKLCEKYPKHKDLFKNLPRYKNSKFNVNFRERIENNPKKNDIFQNHQAFIFNNNLEIIPIKKYDNISFSDLKGYKEQKEILFNNTKALLSGTKVNNILLYGDAGCGKSSSVKALLNEFSELKIIQIFKEDLINLDKLFLKLENLPYKFIIFADDISFDESDKIFSTLKALIEGSLICCPDNVTIYATSNRRHLIKESFSSRHGDEIHLKDTLNETNSLSERFGINLFFAKPSNEEFNKIILELAKDKNINLEENILIEKAQRLALIKGNRSPRIAKQFIDNLASGINI